MDKIKILAEGYARAGENGNYFASPSSYLVNSNDKKVLIDPGANKDLLLKALEDEGLAIEDIDILFLTHYHPDHFLNIKLFPNNDLYDSSMIWKNDEEITYETIDGKNTKIPGTEIEILLTPGHSAEHCSLLVNIEEGVVCIAQDVFWWEDGKQKVDNYEEIINYEDPFASDFEALKESRKKVLEIADIIIPGHGKMFKNIFKVAK